jgi:HEAT repeat protein
MELLNRLSAALKSQRLRKVLRRSTDFYERELAARELGELGERAAVRDLGKALREKEHPNVRHAAARSLGHIADVAAIEPLAMALKDEDSVLRWLSTEALGKIPHPKVVPHLVRILAEDSGVLARASAAEALAHFDGNEVLDALVSALTDNHHEVRRLAAWALWKKEWEPDSDHLVVRHFVAARGNGYRLARYESLKDLGELVIEALLEELSYGSHRSSDEEAATVRKWAARELAARGDLRVEKALLDAKERAQDSWERRDLEQALKDLRSKHS